MNNSLTKLLFEDLSLLLLAEVIAIAIALGVHRRWFTSRSRRAVWITLGMCLLLIVVQSLVVTDREALTGLVEVLVEAVDQGDLATIRECLDDRGVELGTGDGLIECGREIFVQASSVGLQKYQVDQAGAGGFKIEVDEDNATVVFRVTCDLRSSQTRQFRNLSYWEIRCVRREAGWKVRHVVSGKMGLLSSTPMIDILPYMKSFYATARSAFGG